MFTVYRLLNTESKAIHDIAKVAVILRNWPKHFIPRRDTPLSFYEPGDGVSRLPSSVVRSVWTPLPPSSFVMAHVGHFRLDI